MISRSLILKLTGLFVVMFAAAASVRANSVIVRGGSEYGDGDSSTYASCAQQIVNVLNDQSFENCEGYVQGTFAIGGNTYNGDMFDYVAPGGSDFGTIDVIQLAAGAPTLTLNLTNITDPTGLFACGGSSTATSAASSDNPDLTGLYCSEGTPASGFSDVEDQSAVVTESFTQTGVSFTNVSPSAIAIFTSDGNIAGATFTPGAPVPAPEPSSFILLGLGLLAVGWKYKSNQSNACAQVSV